eukprot:CAMPEP_0197529946 /NCGR_PEP_ID=MMETSP1318-20131121/30166_1 /TAXON_ID=552666 /ORGANISM="Partenskyella glossopodia, Strain RCC365" /LENGTH=167 /DNA_ID=CAMNT_0043085581 /DNA_START=183 /DNA_END=686 /DNA_ORIENTATION=+
MAEIKAGRKTSHWSWYMFPTPPYPGASSKNYFYSLKSREEGLAFLRFETDGVSLRQNYIHIMNSVASAVESGIPLSKLVGYVDEPKVVSSVQYFAEIAVEAKDSAVSQTVERVALAAEIELPEIEALVRQEAASFLFDSPDDFEAKTTDDKSQQKTCDLDDDDGKTK